MLESRSPRRSPLATSLLVFGALTSTWAAAAPQKSAANVEADLAFARGLASKWSFVDLAEEVLREVSSGRLDSDEAATLALLRCEIYSVGARNERDPAKRNQLFDEAIACLDSYITSNSGAPTAFEAKEAFVQASQIYARSLQIALEDAVGEEAPALRKKRYDVLKQAKDRCDELIEALSLSSSGEGGPSEADIARRYELMLSKGQIASEMSTADGDEPGSRVLAIDTLEALIFEANEGTPFALRASAALGEVYYAGKDYETAAAFYDSVADNIIPFSPQQREELLEWSKMEAPLKQRRFLFVELGMGGILRSYLALDDTATAIQRALYFWNLYRKESFQLSQFGYESLLEIARVMLASEGTLGGDLAAGQAEWFATAEEATAKFRQARLRTSTTAFARQVAGDIAQNAPSNALKTAAGKLLNEIARRPGQTISLDEMFNGAMAKFREKDFAGTREAVNAMLVRMDALEAAERVEYGARVYFLLGEALRYDGRNLEAAYAYREGAVNWRDEEYDEKNAKYFQALVAPLARAAGDDPDMRMLLDEAENVVANKGPALQGDAVFFNRGKRAQDAEKWTDAITEYEKVGENAVDYEVAYVNIGVCMFRAGQVADALKRFDAYLDQVRVDPKRATESPAALAKRKGASATAEFYRGFILHAVASKRFDSSQDAAGFRKVLENYDGFDVRYEDQPSLCAIALKLVVDSHAKLSQADEAQATLDKMVARFPDDKQTAAAAVTLFKTLTTRLEQRTAANAPEAEVRGIKTSMARAIGVSNRISASPDYPNLKQEGDLWFELGDWARAKDALSRVVAKFSDDDKRRSQVEKIVIPRLGQAMIELRELNDAKDLLGPVATSSSATKAALQTYARAVTGWLEGGTAGITVVPGAGGTPEEFAFIAEKLTAIAGVGDKWTSCEWYEDKFAEMYTYYVWGQIDERRKDSAKNMIEGVHTFLENDTTFNVVEQYCAEDGDTPAELRQRLGGGVLRARYQWLWSRTR